MDLRSLTDPVVAEATGRAHRHDEALPSGGPAGNARGPRGLETQTPR